ncbi:MAG: DUF72 domain-containing protein [Smithellaceae bacterium]
MKFYIGTSGYGYKEWKGIFYLEKIKPQEMLGFYAQHLGTVEINNTFYRMPTAVSLTAWSQQVPNDFVFAFKAPQAITHMKRLRQVGDETQYLFRTLSILHNKLGPVLFQFPRSFPIDHEALEKFIGLIPDQALCAFEFRNISWIDDRILNLLAKKGCSLCTTDADDNPATKTISTASWGYLRLRRSDYTAEDLVHWLKKIRLQKWENVFVFFKHENEAKGPQLAMAFRNLSKNSNLSEHAVGI